MRTHTFNAIRNAITLAKFSDDDTAKKLRELIDVTDADLDSAGFEESDRAEELIMELNDCVVAASGDPEDSETEEEVDIPDTESDESESEDAEVVEEDDEDEFESEEGDEEVESDTLDDENESVDDDEDNELEE